MSTKRIIQVLVMLFLTGFVSVACKAQEVEELDDVWLKPVEFRADSKV